MSKRLISFSIMMAMIVLAAGATAAAVETKAEHDARMQWWREARFGLFIHWGLYAVPAGAWGGKTNYGEWIRNNAQIPLPTYDKFVAQFNPVKFDAAAWVRAARDAGMKYIVITSKHHDGFAIFDSKISDFDIMATPFKRDILKELAAACKTYGLKLCFYHSIMDWHHPDYLPRRPWEVKDRPATGAVLDRYIAYMKAQLKELLTNYGEIGVLWFDGEWENTWTEARGRDLYQYVRSLQPSIIINNRVGASRSGMEGLSESKDSAGDFGTPEQQIPATGLPGLDWETCMTMNENWGYNKLDQNWKSSRDLIRNLADIASKGGNFLLNVGPTAEGLFPDPSLERLAAMGRWMKANGESIYGTAASPFKSLPWGRATQKAVGADTRIYLHVFEWPKDGLLVLPGLLNEPQRVYLLADAARKPLKAVRREDALHLTVPAEPPDADDSVLVLEIAGQPDVNDPPTIAGEAAIFTDSIEAAVTSDRTNVEIRYTLDGAAPTASSPLVRGPVKIMESAVLSARCFRKDRPVSGTAQSKFTKVVPRPAAAVAGLQPGLRYAQFEGEWDAVPDFSKMKPAASGPIARFERPSKKSREKYGLEFTGFLRVPASGVYTLFVSSDDGSRLWIGDDLVVDNDGLHGMTERRGVVALAAGLHPITVRFFNKTGDEGLTVAWLAPGGTKQVIPDSVFWRK
jgi:alpha-L-fucosidase